MKQLKLEVGKTYRSREGKVVRIVEKIDSTWPFVGDNEESYNEQGRYYWVNWDSPYDLIDEGPDPILQFFTPSRTELLSISAIETAAGIPPRTLYKFLKGTRGLPKKHREPLIEILKKVGYDG
jgi:hypothetical protein